MCFQGKEDAPTYGFLGHDGSLSAYKQRVAALFGDREVSGLVNLIYHEDSSTENDDSSIENDDYCTEKSRICDTADAPIPDRRSELRIYLLKWPLFQ